MTEEELQAKLEETESELTRLKGENEKLTTNQSKQNSYITELESAKNGLTAQLNSIKEAADKPALDPNLTAYFKKKYVEDFVIDGKKQIVDQDTKGVFPLLEKDLDEFLKVYMNEENASIKFILDSYSLILGRAIADPDHPINKVEEAKDNVQPTQTTIPIIEKEFPPIVTDQDQSSGTPEAKREQHVPDTKAAFRVLEDRLFNQGKYD